jgi:hypothetical protein
VKVLDGLADGTVWLDHFDPKRLNPERLRHLEEHRVDAPVCGPRRPVFAHKGRDKVEEPRAAIILLHPGGTGLQRDSRAIVVGARGAADQLHVRWT